MRRFALPRDGQGVEGHVYVSRGEVKVSLAMGVNNGRYRVETFCGTAKRPGEADSTGSQGMLTDRAADAGALHAGWARMERGGVRRG